jgi:AraC family transcriptional regulator
MIKLTGRHPSSQKYPVPIPRVYASAGDYVKTVATASSAAKGWDCLTLFKTQEMSNDVTFSCVAANTLVLELTGTSRHLSVLDGKFSERQTTINDVCQMPHGMSARFAWQTLVEKQYAVVAEFDVDIFTRHCPEIVTGSFLAGHLQPSDFSQNTTIAYLIRLLSNELEPTRRQGRLFEDTLIRLLALELGRRCWTRKPASEKAADVSNKKIQRALDFIEEHYVAEVTLKDLSTLSGLNAAQLIAGFRRHVGTTPYAHVLNRRVQQAIHLLKTNDMPIAEVAAAAGFSDQQQMSHLFRKRFCKTPGWFRQTR